MMERENWKCMVLLFWVGLTSQILAAPSYITQDFMIWQRGADGSTWQEWTFDDSDNPAVPENFYNPYGSPNADLYGFDGSVAFKWNPSALGRDGVWTGDPVFVDLFIPNSPVGNPQKVIWFEMEYRAVEMLEPVVSLSSDYQVERVYYDSGIRRDDNGCVIDDWRIMVIGWEIYPNPDSETISFALAGTGGFLNRVSVDTICLPIPAPGSVLLCAVGVLFVRVIRQEKSSLKQWI